MSSQKRNGRQSAKKKYLSALTQQTPTMRRACVSTAIMQRVALKWLTSAAIQIGLCIPKESARIATLASTTRAGGKRKKSKNRSSRPKKLYSLAKNREIENQKLKQIQLLSQTQRQIDHN